MKKGLNAFKKRIIAALLCLAMLSGTIATDYFTGREQADDAHALELFADDTGTDSDPEITDDDITMEEPVITVEPADDSVEGLEEQPEDVSSEEVSEEPEETASDIVSNDLNLFTTDNDAANDTDDQETITEDMDNILLFGDSESVSENSVSSVSENSLSMSQNSLFSLFNLAQIAEDAISNMVTIRGYYDILDMSVKITGSADALTDATGISIEMVEDTANQEEKLEEIGDGAARKIVGVFDIYPVDADGNQVYPDDVVTVSISGGIIDEIPEDERNFEVYSYDFFDGLIDMNASYEDDVLSFDTDSFSTFIFTTKAGAGEIIYDERFEMDKFLSVNATEVNGQPSATITIENAYFSNDRNAIKLEKIPTRSDVVMLIDASSSMKNYTWHENNYMLYFLYNVMLVNQERENKAKNNEYEEFDYFPGVTTDAEFNAFMSDHYIYVDGIVKFNNRTQVMHANEPLVIRSWNDIHRLISCGCSPSSGCGQYHYDVNANTFNPNVISTSSCIFSGPLHLDNVIGDGLSHIHLGTRTDLGTQQALQWVRELKSINTQTSVIMFTDGRPNCDANTALNFASQIKQEGATVYVAYDCGSSEYVDYLKSINANGEFRLNRLSSYDNFDLAFMSIYSSDYPSGSFSSGHASASIDTINPNIKLYMTNGCVIQGTSGINLNDYVDTIDNGKFAAPYTIYDYNGNSAKYNTFGNHLFALSRTSSAMDNVVKIAELVAAVDTKSTAAANSIGYGGVESYIYDEITDPFEIQDVNSISVYKVPRIPKELDENGVPVKLDTSKECHNKVTEIQMLDDDDFRWGEKIIDAPEGSDSNLGTEWINITDSVTIHSAELADGIVKISGIDYEHLNSARNFDIDYMRKKAVIGDTGFVYHTGDYGYKIVVEIPIVSKTSFGGNNIKTNNTDISGFYPSEPVAAEGEPVRPVWTKNVELNPDGNVYVGLYPECKMNLKANYNIICDSAIIYAPERKKIHDLVTDANNNMWYVDMAYHDTLTQLEDSRSEYNRLVKQIADAEAAAGEDDSVDDTALTGMYERVNELMSSISELNDTFNSLACYIPDGHKNAFVDIDYSLTSPSGREIATMHIPHGMAFYDIDGKPSIDWTVTDGEDAIITESGEYTISATVTPVATEKSPSWHVRTGEENDSDIPYDSLDYSPTGSDGIDAAPNDTVNDIGPGSPVTIEDNCEAYLFTLEIMADDSSKEPHEIIDVNRGVAESVIGLASLVDARDEDGVFTCKKETQTHIRRYQWMCTDGITQSDPKNEPVNDADIMLLTKIPDSAIGEDGLVKDTNGSMEIIAEDGGYVPVASTLSRKFRLCNKDENSNVWSPDTIMSDSDNIYGDGISSVSWGHVCEKSATCEEDGGEFADARASYGTDIRYLIHVLANVPPAFEKTAEKELISGTEKIKWNIDVSNTDEESNPKHRDSKYQLIDILPYEGDGRYTEFYNDPAGSQFHGVLRYEGITIDFSKAPSALAELEKGDSKMCFSSSKEVNGYPDILSPNELVEGQKGVVWKEAPASGFSVDGGTVTFSGFDPDSIYAFKFETKLAFGEEITIHMTADCENPSAKDEGDYYVNEAYIYQGKGFIRSDRVPVQITPLSVSGTIWTDTDYNGVITDNEPHMADISVGIYKEKDEDSLSTSTVMRSFTIPGRDGVLDLVKVYDKNDKAITNVITTDNGNFTFTNLKPGHYYIVADEIPFDYSVTGKHKGDEDRKGSPYDSEAEEAFLDNGDNTFRDNSAIIMDIEVGLADDGSDRTVTGMNVGIAQMTGTIRVGKCTEIMKIPQTFTDEQRADFKVPVLYYLKNKDTDEIYTKGIVLTEENCTAVNGRPQVWAEFEDVPLGTYEVYENTIQGNNEVTVVKSIGLVTVSDASADVTLNQKDSEAELWFENHLIDGTYSYNHMNIRTPIKLDLMYHDNGPIGMGTDMKSYVFKAEDFDDIVVTYDDGSTISLAEGTLNFEDIVLTPGGADKPITRFMNTGETGKPTTITGFYSERGHIVTDTFPVRVALKNLYKFTVQFDCNYDANDNGKNAAKGFEGNGFGRNSVTFLYDEDTKETEVTNGIYKDAKNGKLAAPSYMYGSGKFTQYGWNTKTDASGTPLPFNVSDPNNVAHVLEQIGDYMFDRGLSDMVWYADWKGQMTFDANGTHDYTGFLVASANSTAEERAGANKKTVQLTFSKNQPISTTLVGRVSNSQQEAHFDHWNFYKENKEGYDLVTNNPPTFQGGETYYGIYYVTEFKYSGKGDVFTAPTSGSYTFKLWGSPGYGSSLGGGYTEVTMNLKRGEQIYAFVGSAGAASTGNDAAGGYNGGGPSVVCLAGAHNGSGGGATHISRANNPIIADAAVRVLSYRGSNQYSNPGAYSYKTITLFVNYGRISDAWIRNQMRNDPYYGPYITDSTPVFRIGAEWYIVACHTWWNIDKVIAVAGGAGGGFGNQYDGYAGGDVAHPGHLDGRDSAYANRLRNANNMTNSGYAYGAGMYTANGGGGGAGWLGGFSANIAIPNLQQTNGGHCGAGGGGGTSYVSRDPSIISYHILSGNDGRLAPGQAYQKPATEGVNGYIKVIKN